MKKLILIVNFIFYSILVNAIEIRVSSTSNCTGPGCGSSWSNAFSTLQDALQNANPGDEIWVKAGTYFSDAANPGNSSAFFSIPVSNVGIYGGFNGSETSRSSRNWSSNTTILSGNQFSQRLFYLAYTDDITIDGFTLESTVAASWGWGTVLGAHDSKNIVIQNCIIQDNIVPSSGQGCFRSVAGSDITIKNCLIKDNQGDKGSIANVSNNFPVRSKVTFINSTIINNVSNSLLFESGYEMQTEVAVINTIIKNSGNSTSGNVIYDHSITDFPNNSPTSFNQDPSLDANFSPSFSGSIAVGNGKENVLGISKDLEGNTRIIDERVDIGAIEFQNDPIDYWRTDNYRPDGSFGCYDYEFYKQIETVALDDNSLISGGHSSPNCEGSQGGLDLKVIKVDMIGNILFDKKYGSQYDDRLVKLIPFNNSIYLLGNTDINGVNQIFIHELNMNGDLLNSTFFENATLHDAVIGPDNWFHLTGEEENRMFYSKLLTGSSSPYIFFKGNSPEENTVGNAITVDEFGDDNRVVIVGAKNTNGDSQAALWSIVPSTSSAQFIPHNYSGTGNTTYFKSVNSDETGIYIGGNNSRIIKLNKDMTSVVFDHNDITYNGLVLNGMILQDISDIEIYGNQLIVSALVDTYSKIPNFIKFNKMTGELTYDFSYQNPSVYGTNNDNKFDIDNFGNICFNGTYINDNQPDVTRINIARIDLQNTFSCSIYEITLTYPAVTSSISSNGPCVLASNFQAINGNWVPEITNNSTKSNVCISSASCDNYVTIPDVLSNNQIPTTNSDFPCRNVLAFNGPSESMTLNTATSYVSYYWITSTGTYSSENLSNLPSGLSWIALLAFDSNGCPYYQKYCIRNVNLDPIDDKGVRGPRLKSPGIEEVNALSVYPNPSSGDFNVTFKAGKYLQLIVRDLTGRVIKEINLINEDQSIRFDLNNEAKGVYIVSVIGENDQENMKITKQ